MTRMSKQQKRRNMCPKRRSYPLFKKTGPKKDKLKDGYKPHENAISSKNEILAFIPKIQ